VAAGLLATGLLAGCATAPVPATPPPAAPARPEPPAAVPPDANEAAALPLALATATPWSESTTADATPALRAFRASCPALVRRNDTSGLTQPADWADACADAAVTTDPAGFFARWFLPVSIGDGEGLDTGYFEPELAGSLTRGPGFEIPLYRRPPELVDVDLGQFRDTLKGQRIAGQVQGGQLVPYPDRAAIEDGALAGRGLELAWAADIHEAFFLQIQGSGRLKLPDGKILRVGYDGQNGQPYVGIGRRLLDKGLLAPGQATMQGVIAWARANPDLARSVMRENRSFVFFRELKGDAPVGALGVGLTPRRSIAVDPRFIPLGAPVWLDSRHPDPAQVQRTLPLSQLMIAQDTGGAIKGPNRIDVFWGAGEDAARIAGAMAQKGRLRVLLPHAAVQRLAADHTGLRPPLAEAAAPPRP